MLTAAINDRRDRILLSELRARDLDPQRVFGVAGDGAWREAGWCFAHDPDRSLHLIHRYQQAAAYVLETGRRRILWADGRESV